MRGVHSKHHLLTLDLKLFGNLVNARLLVAVFQLLVYEYVYLLRKRFCPSRHFHRAVVAQKTLYLSAYHRHGVGGKTHPVGHVEVLYRFDKSDCSELHKVVVFSAPLKSLDNRFYKRYVFPHEFFFRAFVTALRLAYERKRRVVV